MPPVDKDMTERLVRLEANQEHFEKTQDKLVDVTKDIGEALSRLTQQMIEQQRLSEHVHEQQQIGSYHTQQISLINQQLEPLKELPKLVQKNTFVTNIAVWVAALLVTGAVGTIFALIKL